MKITKTENQILKAAVEAIARRDRVRYPKGTSDGAGRFELDHSERCACCEGIRSPSRAYPYTQLTHGCSIKHVAHLFGVSEYLLLVKRVARAIDTDRASNPGSKSDRAGRALVKSEDAKQFIDQMTPGFGAHP